MTLLQAIKAASFIMAKKDVRYFLNGVHIVKKDNVVTVEATDGHMGFQTRDVDTDSVDVAELDMIIPCSVVAVIIKSKHLVIKDGNFVSDGMVIPMQPIDGNFPQMDRVMPSRYADVYKGELYSVNPEYIMAVGKSYKAATGFKHYSGLVSRNIAGGVRDELLSSVLMHPMEHALQCTNWVVMPQRIG